MAAYKVINLDSPIESDYWVDIPVRDPATNKDAVDEKGRILVERHVTRSVKNEEMSTINTAVETVNTLKVDYSTFKEEVSTKVNNHDSSILTNTNNITTLTDSVNNHDLQIHALYSKINAIKGIDIDDFKYVTETDIKNIKNSYLPLVGGTLTGSLRVQGNETEVNLLTNNPSVGSIYLYATKTAKGLGAIGTNNVFACLANITPDNVATFYGSLNGNATSSTKTTNDSVDRNIVSTYALKSHYPDRIGINWDTTFKGYVNLTVDQTTWGLITTANIAQQSVNYANSCNTANFATTADRATNANHATNADNATNADHATNANHAKTADSATNANHATTADSATNANHATTADTANRAFPRNSYGDNINFHWEGKNGQPTWLWGGNDPINMYVYSPAAFSVNYATYADHATRADTASRSTNNGSFFINGYEVSVG